MFRPGGWLTWIAAFTAIAAFSTPMVLAAPAEPSAPKAQRVKSADPAWNGLLARLQGAAEFRELLTHPDDRREQLELYRYVLMSLSDGYQLMAATDANFPLWSDRFLNYPTQSIGVNPDTLYLSTLIEENGIYRIWGKRGTTKEFVVQLNSPVNEPGKEGLSRTLKLFNVDQLHLGPDGGFEVMLSRDKPAGWNGDWWPMAPGTGFSFARQVSYDWDREQLGELHIERLNPSLPKTGRKTAKEVERQLDDIVRFALGNARRWVDHVAKLRRDGIVNKFRINTMQDIGGSSVQSYWEGAYALADDEALIVTVTLPQRVAYWNVQLSSDTWETLDYFNRISSLNGMQASAASDGRFYVVISKNDPGVPNWLDTGGYDTGHIYGRWNNASDAPLPDVKRVKFADLSRQLPADTPAISTEQRLTEIAARRRGVQRHFRY